MDLNDFIPTTDEIVVNLKHPKTKEDLGMTVTVYAPHTEQFKEVSYKYIDAAIARNAKARKEGKDEYQITAKEADTNRVTQLAEITKTWDITLDGKKPKFSRDKAVEIYNKLPFVRVQVEEALEKTEDFM